MLAMNLFNDNAMPYYREIPKRRQKQVSFDRFLVKVTQKEKESTDTTFTLKWLFPALGGSWF
jgi:hypothetical protein